MTACTAAVLQMRSGTDPDRNAADFSALVAEAAAGGARYVQSPEMTGMLQRDRAGLLARLKGEHEDPILVAAAALARRHALFLHVGSVAVAVEGGCIANRSVLFAPDGTAVGRLLTKLTIPPGEPCPNKTDAGPRSSSTRSTP